MKGLIRLRAYFPYAFSVTLILLAIAILYGNDLEILVKEASHNEVTSHVILVPFFAAFLIYRKKDMIMAQLASKKYGDKGQVKHLDAIIGVALCLVTFLLYWYGSHTFHPLEYHLLSLPIFVAGIVLILFNFKILVTLIFPILFLLFLIPPPTETVYMIGGAIANFNTQASYTVLHHLGLPVTLQLSFGPPLIAVTRSSGQPMSFAIDVPCSGIYSLTAFLMLGTFLALVVAAPIFKRAGLIIFGVTVFAALNIARIVATISVGYWLSEEIAMSIFHTFAGWIFIILGMLFILFVVEKIFKIGFTGQLENQSKCPTCNISLGDFCLNCGRFIKRIFPRISPKFCTKLLILVLSTYLVTLSIQAPTFAATKGPNGLLSNSDWENATNIFPQITDHQLEFLYRDVEYERIAGQDASLLYGYFPLQASAPTIYVDLGVADTISNLHSWEVCLITWQTYRGHQPVVSVLNSSDVQLLQDVPIIARYLVFNHPDNYTQVTLYWYEKAMFNTGFTVEQKYVRISLIILTRTPTNYQKFEPTLLEFGQTIASFWEPLKSKSLISIGVPLQQTLLGITIAFVAFAKPTEYLNRWRRKNSNMKIFNTFASEDEKLVFETTQELLGKTSYVQIELIASTLASKTGTPPRQSDLISILTRLEDYGLLKTDVVSIQGNPTFVFRA